MQPALAALDVPATRRSLRRRWGIVAGLVVLVVVVALAAGATLRARDDASQLQRDGVPTTATVTAVRAHPAGRGRTLSGSIDVQVVSAAGLTTASVYVGTHVAQYHEGDHVTVVYDRADPARVALPGTSVPRRGVPLVVLAVLGGLLLAMAIVAGRHAWAIAAVVRTEPWVAVPARLIQGPVPLGGRRRARFAVELSEDDGPLRVEPVGLNRVDPSFTPTAWMAGASRSPRVLATDGGAHLVLVRLVGG